MTQKEKALFLRKLHSDSKLLLLPNVWDRMSAKLIEACGFPAIATASVATSLSNGYRDGEQLPFARLVALLADIVRCVDLPVTADIEHGFAADITSLEENIKTLILNGVVGINLEDGKPGMQGLEATEDQCKRIEAVKTVADRSGIPIVINARIDVFLQRPGDDQNLSNAIARAKAYVAAGADCVYPIMINKYEQIQLFVGETNSPVNVNLQKGVSDLRRLENIGVSRVSLGPGFLYHSLSKLRETALALKEYDTGPYYSTELFPKDFLQKLI